MAISRKQDAAPVDAHELAAAFAELIGHEPSVLRVWMSSHRGVVGFWLLTPEIESDEERRLYRFSGDLQDRFPEALFHLHLLNPRYYESFDLDVLVPRGAEEIALHPARSWSGGQIVTSRPPSATARVPWHT